MSASRPYRRPETPIDLKATIRQLNWIHKPEFGCFEIRIPKAWVDLTTNAIVTAPALNPTMGGYFNDPEKVRADLCRLEGASAYVVFNPIDPALMNRANSNRILSTKEATKDEDVKNITRAYLDTDSVRPSGISATDDELARAIERQHYIFDHEPEIMAAAHWGCSGNGGWTGIDVLPMSRLNPDPADLEWIHPDEWVAHFLAYLGVTYSTSDVKVDPTTKNPSRIGCLVGTWKCKGVNADGTRPWRPVTMDSPDRPTIPLDLQAYCLAHPLPEIATKAKHATKKAQVLVPANGISIPSSVPNGHSSRPDLADRQRRAAAYLSAMSPAISGQNGHGQTFDAACAVVKGFDLSPAEAYPALSAWNQTCQPPWEDHELWHKLREADDKPDDKPRGYTYDVVNPNLPDRLQFLGGFEVNGKPETNGHVKKKGRRTNEALDDPHRLARIYKNSMCTHPDGRTLHFYREVWMRWRDNCYKELSRGELLAGINRSTKIEFDKCNRREIEAWFKNGGIDENGKKVKAPQTRKVNVRLVHDINQALTDIMELDNRVVAPSWLKYVNDFDSDEIIPCKNGLVHIPSFLEGSEYMTEPTPSFFGTYSLSYDFDPDAPSPVKWLSFLNSIFGDDLDSINALQEWFGYCLTSDTSQQKILGIIGPKRAGKDTIARVLRAMIGTENVVGPTMSSLGTNFGLSEWIDIPLAIISDARLSGRTDFAIVVERLLTVSGEGTLSIDRKFLSAWHGKLPTRIMIISNELPRLADSSGALASRLLILRLTRSFYGYEDTGLFRRLSQELPSILLWAIEGWRRLRDRGFFVQPPSGQEMVEEMEDLSSPIGVFFRDRCIQKPGSEIEVSELYRIWKYWCDDNGRKDYGDIQTFGRNLGTLLPDLKIEKRRKRKTGSDELGHTRIRYYIGITLNPDWSSEESSVSADEENDQSPF